MDHSAPQTPPDAPELAESPSVLRLLADNVPALISYYEASSLRCRFANAAYARTYSCDTRSIIGKTVEEIIGAQAAAAIRPYIDEVMQGRTSRYERPLVFPNGAAGVIEVTLVPHLDEQQRTLGAFVLINDITRHRRTEQALRDNEERLRKFSESTTEGIVFIDEGVIVDCNLAAASMVRLSERELTGRSIIDFIAPDSVELILNNIRAGFEKPYEATLLRADGSRFAAEIVGKNVVFNGKPMRMSAMRDISERKQAEARIQFLAHHDTLTHLPNRAMVLDRLQVVIASARRQAGYVAVLFVDLDNFKTINDSLGHHAGDELLKRVAGRLKACVREADLIGRLGGDEFLVVITDLEREEDVAAIAEKISQSICEPFTLEDQQLSVSSSIGISLFPRDGETPETLVRNADAAMYLAKDQGRSNFQFFMPSLNKAAFHALSMESGIRKAIRQLEFLLHYQPALNLATQRIESIEALIRWKHPDLGMLGPDQFISVAEHRGLIVPIGRWVINEAIRQVRAWNDEGVATRVAINLSAVQFKQKDLVDDLAARLREHGVSGEQVEIELTESLFLEDVSAVTRTLARLKDLGMTLSVDDFGTGYSSLAYLKRYPIDRVKIDRTFVRDIPGDSDDVAIVLAIIGLAHSLGIEVVAEGVENSVQMELLKGHGCDAIQGYLVSRPMPPADVPGWMRQRPALA
ncbi:MAG TPA: EAL domain-containing protein [Usitatibacteraceae bacterium]|nr:EAL domain-containing protein [Usitatibacteraceae bacterium]